MTPHYWKSIDEVRILPNGDIIPYKKKICKICAIDYGDFAFNRNPEFDWNDCDLFLIMKIMSS